MESDLQKHAFPFWEFLRRILQAHGRSLLLLLLGVGLPLFLFESLAMTVWRNQGGFLWDEPILLAIHQTTSPELTQLAVTLTQLGGFKAGVVLSSGLSLVLLLRRRWRSFLYLILATGGSGLINRVAKSFLHRVRPNLWESAAPELDFAFPSGHATVTMTVVVALIILTWGTRFCWLICLGGGSFVLAIAWTRLYLGVHFPSDILAGWLVSIAWAVGVALVIRPHLTQVAPLDEVQPTAEELSHSSDGTAIADVRKVG